MDCFTLERHLKKVKPNNFLQRFLGLAILFCCSSTIAQPTFLFSEVVNDSITVEYYQVAENLSLPWEMVYGDDDHLWFSQSVGKIMRLNPQTGNVAELLTLPDIAQDGSLERSRMVGFDLDSDFANYPYLYIAYSYYGTPYANHNLYLKLVQYTYNNLTSVLENPLTLLDGVKIYDGFHVGGKVLMTADRKVLLTIGDAKQPENPELHPDWTTSDEHKPQDLSKFSGKVIRINPDGTVPLDNPFATAPYDLTARNLIYTYGHRNHQGMVQAPDGTIYYTEHGGHGANAEDELGILKAGQNYGWPYIEGWCNGISSMFNENDYCNTLPNYTDPIYAWFPDVAPSNLGLLSGTKTPFKKDILLAPTLNSEGDGFDLRLLFLLNQNNAGEELILADGLFGRLRDVAVARGGEVYFTTSNTMWGAPVPNDDRIIKAVFKKQILSSIDERPNDLSIKVLSGYDGEIRFVVPDELVNTSYSIFNLLGQLILEDKFELSDNRIKLESGIFIIRPNSKKAPRSIKFFVR